MYDGPLTSTIFSYATLIPRLTGYVKVLNPHLASVAMLASVNLSLSMVLLRMLNSSRTCVGTVAVTDP